MQIAQDCLHELREKHFRQTHECSACTCRTRSMTVATGGTRRPWPRLDLDRRCHNHTSTPRSSFRCPSLLVALLLHVHVAMGTAMSSCIQTYREMFCSTMQPVRLSPRYAAYLEIGHAGHGHHGHGHSLFCCRHNAAVLYVPLINVLCG